MALADFAGGLQGALADIIKDRLEAEEVARQIEQQRFVNQRALVAEGLNERKFGESARQFDLGHEIDAGNLDLRRGEFGLQTRMYDEGAPQRAATLKHTDAQTGDLLRKPEAEAAGRAHDLALEDHRGKWGLRTIGAQGAEQRRTQAHGAGLKTTTPQEEADVQTTLDLIRRLKSDPNLAQAVGALEGRGGGRLHGNDNYERIAALHDQLVGRLQLAQAGKLKGQGQISDRERQMLMSAATSLRRALSDRDYLSELTNVETQFEAMSSASGAGAPSGGRAAGAGPAQGGGMEYDWVNGKLVRRGGG